MAAFSPILGADPEVLILGSMPSQISLSENRYYANPQNSFWWIMSELFEFDLTMEYHDRSIALEQARVAVWDVLYDCERPGSLDSAIVKRTEVPNDFEKFMNSHLSLTRIIFNGAAAEAIFLRHYKTLVQALRKDRPSFELHRCPSTSPAHASVSKHDKLAAWRSAIL